jgi:2-aminoadipate transaminase
MSVAMSASRRAIQARGQPVTELMAQALANPDLISLAAGFVDQQTLPVAAVRVASEKVLQDEVTACQALQYGTTAGDTPLRNWILEMTMQADGPLPAGHELSVDQVVLTAGSNQMLHLIAETLFDPGDIVICANPSYFVFLGILGYLDVRAVGVDVDDEGMLASGLEEKLKELEREGERDRVKAVYLVPYFDNPAGITISAQRGGEILDVVRNWSSDQRLHVIVDEAYRLLRFEGEDVPSMRSLDPDGQTVIVAGTFSKSFSPGIRVGWGILPKDLVEPLLDQKGNIDFGSPFFNQRIMREVVTSEQYTEHVETIRATYQEKRDALLLAANDHLASIEGVRWRRPEGGLYVWLEVPQQVDTGPGGTLMETAIAEGMLYVPGQYCFPADGEQVRLNHIRLSYALQSPQGIEKGIAALARALRQTLR